MRLMGAECKCLREKSEALKRKVFKQDGQDEQDLTG